VIGEDGRPRLTGKVGRVSMGLAIEPELKLS